MALTDEVTRLGDRGVSDEVYDAAAEYFDEQQMAALVSAISMMNLYNRLAVTSQIRPRTK